MPLGRGFGVLWSANALSNLADGVAFVSMPLLAASMTDDPRLVAGLATLYALVRLLVALPIGVWVDRLDRRTLIVAANLLRGVGLLGLAMTIQFGVSSLVVLYTAMAVVGTLESMADSAAVALRPSLVDRERLDSANGRIAAAQLVSDEFAGPPLGGFLFAVAATAPIFARVGYGPLRASSPSRCQFGARCSWPLTHPLLVARCTPRRARELHGWSTTASWAVSRSSEHLRASVTCCRSRSSYCSPRSASG